MGPWLTHAATLRWHNTDRNAANLSQGKCSKPSCRDLSGSSHAALGRCYLRMHTPVLCKVLPHTLPHQSYTESIFRLWDKGGIWITQLMQLFKQHAQHASNKLTVFSGHPTPKLHVTVSKIGFIQSTFEDIFLAFLHTALWSKMWRMLLSFCQNFKTQAKKRKREQDFDSQQIP